MTRLILLIAVLFIAWWLWQRSRRTQTPPPASEAQPMPMVRCRLCGVHTPRDQALQRAQHWYCCREHSEQDNRPEQP